MIQNRSPEQTDRMMLGACAGIWLVWLIVSAIAAVALINLGRGDRAAEGTPWLLYTVIGVSAVIVVGAIPLLLKARRAASHSREAASKEAASREAASREALSSAPPAQRPVTPVTEAPTEKMRVFGTSVEPRAGRHARGEVAVPEEGGVLDQLWLRGTTALLGATGLALIAVALATYLLAVGVDVGAWVALGVAALITVGMPVIFRTAGQMIGEAHQAG